MNGILGHYSWYSECLGRVSVIFFARGNRMHNLFSFPSMQNTKFSSYKIRTEGANWSSMVKLRPSRLARSKRGSINRSRSPRHRYEVLDQRGSRTVRQFLSILRRHWLGHPSALFFAQIPPHKRLKVARHLPADDGGSIPVSTQHRARR